MVCFDTNSYNYKTFDGLPSLHHAQTAFNAAKGVGKLGTLGQLFRQYRQQFNFGLILLHKHFQLSPAEFTVEMLAPLATVSTPWNLSSQPTPIYADFLESNGFPSTDDAESAILPHSWIINNDGTLEPYEFYYTKNGSEQLDVDPAFLPALYKELKALNLERVLGLHRLHRGGQVGLEKTVGQVRANVLSLKDRFDDDDRHGPNSVNVIWTFRKDSEVEQDCFCSGGADDPGGHVHI